MSLDPDLRVSISTAPWAEAALPHALELLADAAAPAVQLFGDEGRGHLDLARWIDHQAAIDGVVVAVRRGGLRVQSLEIGRSCCDIPPGKGGDAIAVARLEVAIEIAVRTAAPLICLCATGLGLRRDPPPDENARAAQAALLVQMCRAAGAAGIRLGLAAAEPDASQPRLAKVWFSPPEHPAGIAGECAHVQFLNEAALDWEAAAAWFADQCQRWPRLSASVIGTSPAAVLCERARHLALRAVQNRDR
ncbi:MAG TPA: hypothetical protein VGM03_15600 [Phycisphaerae bacterium]